MRLHRSIPSRACAIYLASSEGPGPSPLLVWCVCGSGYQPIPVEPLIIRIERRKEGGKREGRRGQQEREKVHGVYCGLEGGDIVLVGVLVAALMPSHFMAPQASPAGSSHVELKGPVWDARYAGLRGPADPVGSHACQGYPVGL